MRRLSRTSSKSQQSTGTETIKVLLQASIGTNLPPPGFDTSCTPKATFAVSTSLFGETACVMLNSSTGGFWLARSIGQTSPDSPPFPAPRHPAFGRVFSYATRWPPGVHLAITSSTPLISLLDCFASLAMTRWRAVIARSVARRSNPVTSPQMINRSPL
jgi:hypothetical protein